MARKRYKPEDTGRRPRRRSSRQAGRPAPLRYAGHPTWPRNPQCTNIRTGPVDGGRSVLENTESQRRQYGLVEAAEAAGFASVTVIDDDLGRSGSGAAERLGFQKLAAAVCAGSVGAVYCIEASTLARIDASLGREPSTRLLLPYPLQRRLGEVANVEIRSELVVRPAQNGALSREMVRHRYFAGPPKAVEILLVVLHDHRLEVLFPAVEELDLHGAKLVPIEPDQLTGVTGLSAERNALQNGAFEIAAGLVAEKAVGEFLDLRGAQVLV